MSSLRSLPITSIAVGIFAATYFRGRPPAWRKRTN